MITATPVISHYHVGTLTLPALGYKDVPEPPITGVVSILPCAGGFAIQVRLRGFANIWGLCLDGFCRYKTLEPFPSIDAAKDAIEVALIDIEQAKGARE